MKKYQMYECTKNVVSVSEGNFECNNGLSNLIQKIANKNKVGAAITNNSGVPCRNLSYIPNSVVNPTAKLYVGPMSEIYVEKLEKDIKETKDIINKRKIYIHEDSEIYIDGKKQENIEKARKELKSNLESIKFLSSADFSYKLYKQLGNKEKIILLEGEEPSNIQNSMRKMNSMNDILSYMFWLKKYYLTNISIAKYSTMTNDEIYSENSNYDKLLHEYTLRILDYLPNDVLGDADYPSYDRRKELEFFYYKLQGYDKYYSRYSNKFIDCKTDELPTPERKNSVSRMPLGEPIVNVAKILEACQKNNTGFLLLNGKDGFETEKMNQIADHIGKMANCEVINYELGSENKTRKLKKGDFSIRF